MANKVWFIELEQKVGDTRYVVRTSPDYMVSQFREERPESVGTRTFKGETSLQDAERAFMDVVTLAVHG